MATVTARLTPYRRRDGTPFWRVALICVRCGERISGPWTSSATQDGICGCPR